MRVKILLPAICKLSGVVVPIDTILEDVKDNRGGYYIGIMGDAVVAVPYDCGAIILKE